MNKMALSLCMLSFFCSAKVITHQQLADLWQSPKEEAKQLGPVIKCLDKRV